MRSVLTPLLVAGVLVGSATAMANTGGGTGWHEEGEATWYGGGHAGHRTTSGETFDPRRLTAAHASLPLGSYVRVTVASSGRSIVVRVNDREPPHGVRCIDLSHEAAARLGIVGRGVADVSLDPALASDMPAEVLDEVAEAPAIARHGRRHRRHAGR